MKIIYSRLGRNGKHCFLTSQTTQLWREFSFDGYRNKVKTHFERLRAVADIRRIRSQFW